MFPVSGYNLYEDDKLFIVYLVNKENWSSSSTKDIYVIRCDGCSVSKRLATIEVINNSFISLVIKCINIRVFHLVEEEKKTDNSHIGVARGWLLISNTPSFEEDDGRTHRGRQWGR